ncbi:MAG: hypothetical protein R2817_04310 [Flavobacteriales bacterium]
MRSTLTLLLLLAVQGMRAQTFFYIDAINVQPTAPTTADPVVLSLFGGLSSTGAQVTSVSASVVGYTVTISIAAQDNGGLTVIVPHTEEVPLGTLPAGIYTVIIDGQFVGDFAPVEDHTFVVSGTFPCDGLVLGPVRWHALTDTTVVVTVDNPTQELFPYPNFILFDAAGDTLAKEQTSLFGLPGSGSVHYLRIHPGAILPAGPFAGRLELWTEFTTQLACTWPITIELCPPPPCVNVQPFIQNIGGAVASGTFNWGILQNGNVVASGSFEVNDEQQFDVDEVCLPPGNYSMICGTDGGPSQGALFYGLWAGPGQETPMRPVFDIIPQPIPFALYTPCLDPIQSVGNTLPAEAPHVMMDADQVTVQVQDGTLREVTVMDPQGRRIALVRTAADVVRIPAQGWSAGVHVVRVEHANGTISVHRVVYAMRY